uniref:Heat shock protein 70 n=1 Tax=Plectus sambesii TaxID=2011161 RepID=A0A914WBV6_9BILA
MRNYLNTKAIPCGQVNEQARKLKDASIVAVDVYLNTPSYEWPVVFIVLKPGITKEEILPIAASRCIASLTIITYKDFGSHSSESFSTEGTRKDLCRKTRSPTVGIDLGTTYSVAAVYRNAKIEILPNNQSTRKSTTASCVSYGEKELLVDESAKKKLIPNHGNVVYDMKRLIGKTYTASAIERSEKYWNFNLEPDVEGNLLVEVRSKYLGKTYHGRPEDVSTKVLERMVTVAAEALGEKPTKAVITVPAYFNQAQKQATLDAAKKAGLEVPELITEPAAAAYAFTFDKNRLNGYYHLLVYDFGGGTFDVVVVTVDNGKVKIKAIGGDTHLGGRDIDDCLTDHVSSTIYRKCGKDCTVIRRNKTKLMQKVEEMKIELSNSLETSVYIGDLFPDIDEEITIKRGELESLCEDIFTRTIELTKRTLSDAKMSPEDIEEVLLVGGSTRIPRVRQLLHDLFPSITLNQTIDADEAVVYGAAIRAAQIDGVIKADISLTEATPLSFGVSMSDDRLSEDIPRKNSVLDKGRVWKPIRHREHLNSATDLYGKMALPAADTSVGTTYSIDAASPTVGIDLGTTYSVVAAYQYAKIQILPNSQSIRKSTTASCVSYGEKQILVGEPAKRKLLPNYGNVVYDMKRLIGKSYTDPTIEKSRKYWNFKLEPNGEGNPVFEVEYLGKTHQIRPEDVSTKVLERMVAVAEEALGEKPTKAVITVPAYFNQAQKQATLNAAKHAGLEVPELITEPAAAAYAFTFDKNRLNGKYDLLVYDFGGG